MATFAKVAGKDFLAAEVLGETEYSVSYLGGIIVDGDTFNYNYPYSDWEPYQQYSLSTGIGTIYAYSDNKNGNKSTQIIASADDINLDYTYHPVAFGGISAEPTGSLSIEIIIESNNLQGFKRVNTSLPLRWKPESIEVSTQSFSENISSESIVLSLSTQDRDSGDSHLYSLINGSGDADNASFLIEGDQLKIVESPDYEMKSSYSIRVRSTDSFGLTRDEVVTLEVEDINESPTDISLSLSTFDENIPAASAVATLSSADPDSGDTFTYLFVSGTGDADNSSFTIDGDQLKINASPDYEAQSSYSIRVKATDAGGLTHEDVLILGVNDINERSGGSSGSGGGASSGGGGSSAGSGGGGGGSSAPSSPSTAAPATTASTPAPGPQAPAPTASPEPSTSKPVIPSQESPVLGIQPQATVITVRLTTPLALGGLQITQAVVGTDQRDTITGSNAGEAISGGKGPDQLTGGGGPDAFIFETLGEFGRRSAEIVTDFDPNEGDKLVISKGAFEGVSRIKFKAVTGIKEAKQAGKSSKNFVYDEKKGMLYYDANGKKNGWGDGGEFAKLLGAPELAKADFVIA